MGSQSIKTYANVQSRQFKKAIGLEADFTMHVARGICVLAKRGYKVKKGN